MIRYLELVYCVALVVVALSLQGCGPSYDECPEACSAFEGADEDHEVVCMDVSAKKCYKQGSTTDGPGKDNKGCLKGTLKACKQKAKASSSSFLTQVMDLDLPDSPVYSNQSHDVQSAGTEDQVPDTDVSGPSIKPHGQLVTENSAHEEETTVEGILARLHALEKENAFLRAQLPHLHAVEEAMRLTEARAGEANIADAIALNEVASNSTSTIPGESDMEARGDKKWRGKWNAAIEKETEIQGSAIEEETVGEDVKGPVEPEIPESSGKAIKTHGGSAVSMDSFKASKPVGRLAKCRKDPINQALLQTDTEDARALNDGTPYP